MPKPIKAFSLSKVFDKCQVITRKRGKNTPAHTFNSKITD